MVSAGAAVAGAAVGTAVSVCDILEGFIAGSAGCGGSHCVHRAWRAFNALLAQPACSMFFECWWVQLQAVPLMP
jgi:hypothetical protein